ncbi:MAG: c-type cytochrome [Acidimicrobiales bacterium]
MTSMAILTAAVAAGCAVDTPAAPADDPQLVLGQEIYQANCASCHGSEGQGGIGWKLNDGQALERYPDPADEAAVVADGRSGMPAFGAKLSAEEIDAVVAYTREVLGS